MIRRRILPAIFIALAFVGLWRLRIDLDILHLLPSDSPVARGLAEYQDKFLQSGELLVVLRSASSETTLAAVKAVAASAAQHSNLVDRLFWQPPANESITDAAQFLAYLWLNSPTSQVMALSESMAPPKLPALLETSRERIATSFSPADLFLLPRDPLNLSAIASGSNESFETPDRFFASEDGRTRLIYLYAAIPLNNYEQCRMWIREIRAMVHSSLAAGGLDQSVKVLLTGRPAFVDEISSGMRSDMSTAVPGTLLLIGLLFYLLHREWIALLILLSTLFVVMIWTALVGSALLGQLNVVSLGFASILLGLAEDFGIVLHQEVKSHPGSTVQSIRALAGPGIFWSALTTAAAFALLNLSLLPGLRDLGTLVAVGIIIGAWAMVFIFLPLLIRFRKSPVHRSQSASPDRPDSGLRRIGLPVTVLLLLAAGVFIVLRPPVFDNSPDVLRPRKSEASEALGIVQGLLGTSGDPYWLIVHGTSVQRVKENLRALDRHLTPSLQSHGIISLSLPLAIWPDVPNQRQNSALLKDIARQKERIFSGVLSNGFTRDALELTATVFSEWDHFDTRAANWPRGRVAEWVLPKFVHRPEGTNTDYIALGLITPGADFRPEGVVPPSLSQDVLLSGWSLLGKSVLKQVNREIPLISALVGLTVICALWLNFKKWSAVALSLAVLAFSAVILLATMAILGWRWNILNLTGLPLLLGMGIDYSIHMQSALQRFQGNASNAFHSVGRALLLAGSTTIIGFVFLGMSSNAGMASLGRVCALGLTILLLTSVFLLPAWTRSTTPRPNRS